jgi:hypothetical protein
LSNPAYSGHQAYLADQAYAAGGTAPASRLSPSKARVRSLGRTLMAKRKTLIESSEDDLPWRRDRLIVNWTSDEWQLWTAKLGREPTLAEFRQHIHDLWDAHCDEWVAVRAQAEAAKAQRAQAEANKVVSLFPNEPA